MFATMAKLRSESRLNQLCELPDFIPVDAVTSGYSQSQVETGLLWNNGVLSYPPGHLVMQHPDLIAGLILVTGNDHFSDAKDVDVMGLWRWDFDKRHYVRQMVGEDVSFKFFGVSSTRTDELYVCIHPDTVVGRDRIIFTMAVEYSSADDHTGDIIDSYDMFVETRDALTALRTRYERKLEDAETRFNLLRKAVEDLSLLPGMSEYEKAQASFDQIVSGN
jgi:hypothetical protein